MTDELTITITRGGTTITTFTAPTLTIGPNELIIPMPNRRAKLTATDVRTIRRAPAALKQDPAWRIRTAQRFGVSPQNIQHILRGRTWKNG